MATCHTFGLSACLVAALASVSLAQGNSLRPVAAGASVGFVKLSTVMDSKILIQDDQAAGQVVDVVMSESGCIDYVVASYEQKYYVVPYSALTFRGPDRVVYIDIAPTQFRRVSFFTGNQWPDFYASNYQQNVFNIFGVTTIRRDGSRSSLKPDLDRDRNRSDQDRVRDRDDANRNDRERPKAGDTPKVDIPIPDKNNKLPNGKDDKPSPTPDKLPTTKPEPGVIDPPGVKPNLPNPAKPSVPKVETPKPDQPKIEQPLKPTTPRQPSNPK